MNQRFAIDIDLGGNKLLNAAGLTGADGAPLSSGSIVTNPDAAINGFILATDRLLDVSTTANVGSGQAYFQQVVAPQTTTLTGMIFRITRSGSVSSGWVGIFSLNGTMLAAGPANNNLMGTEGWKSAPFNAACPVTAGTRYILGVVANGDNIPGFWGATSFGDLNQNISTMPLRSFRKTSVTTLNANQDWSTNTVPHTDSRIFLAAIAS